MMNAPCLRYACSSAFPNDSLSVSNDLTDTERVFNTTSVGKTGMMNARSQHLLVDAPTL